MAGTVIPLRQSTSPEESPSAAELASKVHELAKRSENIGFDHPHFQQRMVERQITMRQVLTVLRYGRPVGKPQKDEWGDWRVKLQRCVAGCRVQVVVAVKERHLDVVTAI